MTIEERFAKIEHDYLRWKDDVAAGRMTEEQLQKALDGTMIEHDERWWMLGVNTGKWYVYDGERWIESTPSSSRRPALSERSAARAPETPKTPQPSSSGSTQIRTPSRAATYLSWASWGLVGLGAVSLIAVVAPVPALYIFDWTASRQVLLAGTFLFGLASVLKQRAQGPLRPLGVAAAWSALGLVLVYSEIDLGGLWWLGEVILTTGVANLVGVVVSIAATALRGRLGGRR